MSGDKLLDDIEAHLAKYDERRCTVTLVVDMPDRKLGLVHVLDRDALEDLLTKD